VFPISIIQQNNLNRLFSEAKNLERVAPAFFEVVKAAMPKTIKVANINEGMQQLIESGALKFIADKNGEILPSLYNEAGKIAKQVRLTDLQLTPDLGRSVVDLQMQMQMAQVVREIREVQVGIANLHRGLQDDRLALAESAWQQLQQASQISDSRLREAKLMSILGTATDAKCQLFRAFASKKRFFDERENKNGIEKLLDVNAQKSGEDNARETFTCLLAITRTVQIETTAYCILGEQNAARLSMKQFSDFIDRHKLNDRDTLLLFNSYSGADHGKLVDGFMDLQKKIAALPLDINETQPLAYSNPLFIEGGQS
jgi:hypothetical protein